MRGMAFRIAARFIQKLADQPLGQRRRVRELSRPLNRLKGINRQVIRDEAESKDKGEDIVKPNRRDIQPSDVFYPPLPRNVAVRDFAETNKDMSKAIDKQIPKDKGHKTVKNLSQYLIETEGGGEGGPEGEQL